MGVSHLPHHSLPVSRKSALPAFLRGRVSSPSIFQIIRCSSMDHRAGMPPSFSCPA